MVKYGRIRDVDCLIDVLRETFDADLEAGRLVWRERPADHFLIERDALFSEQEGGWQRR